ncbi:hypothetical protein NOVOSPHI9U_290026 [Novosphingobium sp. 9U]|nr:hypothetical protein NOVOSPHI9U_290026 [Novosphingobium sp. 9U]
MSMMFRSTCFHTRQGARQGREELQRLGTPKLPTHQHLAIVSNGVNLEHILRLIDTDGNDILLHGPTPRRGSTTTSLHSYAPAGLVPYITLVPSLLIFRIPNKRCGD